MKTVFTNREIVHVYASRQQASGRSNSMSFTDNTFYSYAQPIGQFVDGEASILLIERRFSNTTSQHQSLLRQAVSHFHQIEVGYIPKYGRQQDGAHKDNLKWYREEIAELLKKASRAKARQMIDWHLGRAQTLIDSMTAYVRIFKLDWEVPVIPEDLTAIRDLAKAEAREESARTKERKAEEAKRYAENAKLWLDGEPVHLNDYAANRPTLLRIKNDEVETSRGARFPIAHARTGLALVRSVREKGTEWRPNGHTLHLGHYSINKITPDGTVYAGCHVVPWASIETIAPQLEALQPKEEVCITQS